MIDTFLTRFTPVFAAEDPPAGGEPPSPPASPAGDPPANAPDPATPPGNDPVMPEGLDPKFWDQSSGVKTGELIASWNEMREKVEGMGQAPEDLAAYELTLPDDLDIPAGLDIKFDEKDEMVQAARETAKTLNLSPDAFRTLLAFDAKRQIAEYKKVLAEDAAEKEKLGANGEARITAVESFLQKHLDQEKFTALRPVIWNAKAFEAVEALMAKMNSSQVSSENPGGSPPPQTPPERPADRWYSGSTDKKAG